MSSSPKITLLSEQLRGKTFELVNDQYTVGRIEERDICIVDPTISTFHCSFTKSGSTYILKDNASTNGTRVNNVPIVEQELQNSDIIQMGDVEMLYYCEDKSAQASITRTQTGINLTNNMVSSSSVAKMDSIVPHAVEVTKEKNQKNLKVILGVLGSLGLVIVLLVGYLIYKVLTVK